MRKPALAVLAIFVVALVGCGKAEKLMEAAKVAEQLKDKGTTAVLQEAANDSYDPPADERLTEKQIEMYLKVREKEKQIAKVARAEAAQHAKKAETSGEKSLAGMMEGFKTLGSVADLLTADIRAAQELGFNTAEYQWVKSKVLEASGADYSAKMQDAVSSMTASSIEQMKKQRDAATDEASRKALDEMIMNMEKGRAEMAAEKQVDPSVEYNRNLLSKYENTLNALTQELAKFEDNEGDAQKSMNEWQQKLTQAEAEAAAEAQKQN